MCSRFTITSPPEALRKLFNYLQRPNFPARYNIAPTQPIPVVRIGSDHAREFALVRWGLIPGWVKDPGEFTTLINARSETACEKPSFKSAMVYRRCLIPCDGFYEWTGRKGAKRPFLIRRKDRQPFALAGIWEHWMDAQGSEMESAAVLTTDANAVVGILHTRMPVIIAQEDFDRWLDPEMHRAEDVQEFLQSAADDLLDLTEVSAVINNPRNEGPEVQVPVETGSLGL